MSVNNSKFIRIRKFFCFSVRLRGRRYLQKMVDVIFSFYFTVSYDIDA